MKVLTCCYEYPPLGGGGGKAVAGLLRHLQNRGHTVDLLTSRYGRAESDVSVGTAGSIYRVRCLRIRRTVCSSVELLTYVLAALPRVFRLVRTGRYNLIHAHFIYPDGILAWIVSRISGIPFLLTAHGSDVPGHNPRRFRLLHALLLPLWRAIVRDAVYTVCPSAYLAGRVRGISSQAHIRIIPNGIEYRRFIPRYSQDPGILVVSRIFEQKGIQTLLTAIRDMPDSMEVDIVGDGPYLPELKKQAQGIARAVRFHGYVDHSDPRFVQFFEKARIFVFLSWAENFPNVLLEAMSAGMAIITSRDTGCAELVGDAALLVDARDVSAVRAALSRLLSDPIFCRQLGEKARERVESRFGWEPVAENYERLYGNLTERVPESADGYERAT